MKMISFNWSIWIYGMWVAVASGATNAAQAALVLKVYDPTVFNREMSSMFVYAGWLLLFGGVQNFFIYISKHPAPEIISRDKHEDVKVTALPMRGTGDGTTGNLPERTKTVKTTVEEEVKIASPKPEGK